MRAALLVLLLLAGCGSWPRRPPGAGEVEAALAELAQAAARREGEVAVLGFRDGEGKQTARTRLLDEYLLSALLRSGAAVQVAGGEEVWKKDEAIPARYWSEVEAPWMAAGYLREDPPWVYLRLQVVERQSGTLVAARTRRLAAAALDQGLGQAPVTPAPLSATLHLLALRQEGGFARQVALEAGGRLQPGDRVQIRFEVGVESQVFAFLYSSAGAQRDLFPGQLVYKGRMHYGPAEEEWLSLDETNQVHTLYFIVAPRLDEDKSALFENLAELISQGQVNQFSGIEKLDQAVAAFLAKQVGGDAPPQVLRQEVALGEEEKFILADGTVLVSRPQQLSGAPALVRAISFSVQ